jgi:hypothetical protein
VTWNPDHQFRIMFNGEFMEGLKVQEKVQEVGNRSFDYLIKKSAANYPQYSLAA